MIDGDFPQFLSKEAMKKAQMQIDVTNDVVTIFGQPQKLLFMSFGYNCIPIGIYVSSDGTVSENKVLETVLCNSFDDCSDHKKGEGASEFTLSIHPCPIQLLEESFKEWWDGYPSRPFFTGESI